MGDEKKRFEGHMLVMLVKFMNICGSICQSVKNILKNMAQYGCLIIHIAKYFTIKNVIIKIKTLFL